jgi:hypothetical protein
VIKFAEQLVILIDKFNSLSPGTQDFIIKLGLILAVLGPLAIAIGTVSQVFGLLNTGLGLIIGTIAKTTGFIVASGGIIPALQALAATLAVPFLIVVAAGSIIYAIVKIRELMNTYDELYAAQARMDKAKSKGAMQDYFIAKKKAGQISDTEFKEKMKWVWDNFRSGGIVQQAKFAAGGIVRASNGIVAGQSALTDRVPALLTPGEVVLNKSQQKKLLTGGTGSTTVVQEYHLHVGQMIASPGEQREFVRGIKRLMAQEEKRFA